MKLQLLSVGKAHEPYVKEGIELFTKRLNNYYPANWVIIAPPKNASSLSEQEFKKKEGQLILQQIQPEDYLLLLDERGKNLTSEGLANFIQQRANEATRNLCILIGGAYGVSDAVMERANYKLRLSDFVFPHQLVRLILSEQLYRACTINKNEKYHHT
ncbi:MAG: hypothetical protein RLY16_453 [Bacteroidota bacterium]|jgi:23S rRNA (pseudouridine1915-N3)-methyltransferase